ncbi:MAG TPA: hypothetical protein VEW42_00290 [Candidatus Eisenbacteria bacterium]|nr:hypothetical protein [Candidatus Eisenbacteria bacterium]
MKIQDIIFVIFLAFLLWKRNPYYVVAAGLGCIVISMPLFASWVFFTAERFTYYGGICLLLAIFLFLLHNKKKI